MPTAADDVTISITNGGPTRPVVTVTSGGVADDVTSHNPLVVSGGSFLVDELRVLDSAASLTVTGGTISASTQVLAQLSTFDYRGGSIVGPVYAAGSLVRFGTGALNPLAVSVVSGYYSALVHKGPLIRTFLSRNKRLRLERLPAYAPELNPVEAVWSWLKYGQLANYVPGGMSDLDDEIIDRLSALKGEPDLLRGLCDGSDLPFPQTRRRKQGSLPADQ